MIGATITVCMLLVMLLALTNMELRTYQSRRELARTLEAITRSVVEARKTPGSMPRAEMTGSQSGAL